MTPYQQAKQVYEQEPCARRFEEDLLLHLDGGHVFSSPSAFVMFRGVWSGADPEHICNPAIHFPQTKIDCWHVYLAAGNFEWDDRWFPCDLRYFSFERKNRLRFRSFHKMKDRICHSMNSTVHTSTQT
jgi:hypothetical protein